MITYCHRCGTDFDEDEPRVSEKVNGSEYTWYYHPKCHDKCKEEKKLLDQRIVNVRNMFHH